MAGGHGSGGHSTGGRGTGGHEGEGTGDGLVTGTLQNIAENSALKLVSGVVGLLESGQKDGVSVNDFNSVDEFCDVLARTPAYQNDYESSFNNCLERPDLYYISADYL